MNEQIKFDFWDSTAYRRCTKCKKVKHHTKFSGDKYANDNIKPHCIACEVSHKSLKFKRRRRLIGNYKVKKGCIDCGYNEHAVALHFDHRDLSEKEGGIAVLVGKSPIKKLFAEIRKCDIRCANCHAVKTYTNGDHVSWRDEEEKDV
jgi:hypothetical protein